MLLGVGGCGWTRPAGSTGLPRVDISTGRFALGSCEGEALAAEIARIDPKEIVCPDAIRDDPALAGLWREARAAIARVARDGVDGASAGRRIEQYFGVAALDGFGSFSKAELIAAATVLAYVERTQLGARSAALAAVRAAGGQALQIDAATRANLELTRTLAGQRQGSLLQCIDMTATPAGGRLLAERLAGPLTDVAAIRRRQESVRLCHEIRCSRASGCGRR